MNKEELKVIKGEKIVGKYGNKTNIDENAVKCDILHAMGLINEDGFNKIIILTDEENEDDGSYINKLLTEFVSQISGGAFVPNKSPFDRSDKTHVTDMKLKRY